MVTNNSRCRPNGFWPCLEAILAHVLCVVIHCNHQLIRKSHGVDQPGDVGLRYLGRTLTRNSTIYVADDPHFICVELGRRLIDPIESGVPGAMRTDGSHISPFSAPHASPTARRMKACFAFSARCFQPAVSAQKAGAEGFRSIDTRGSGNPMEARVNSVPTMRPR